MLRAHAAEGRLSGRELEDRVELAFRAGTIDDLNALLAGLDGSSRLAAGVVLAEGIPAAPPRRRKRSFVERQLWYTGAWLVLWVVVWAFTGAGLEWLLLILLSSAGGLTFRLARGERRRLSASRPRRGGGALG